MEKIQLNLSYQSFLPRKVRKRQLECVHLSLFALTLSFVDSENELVVCFGCDLVYFCRCSACQRLPLSRCRFSDICAQI